MSRITKREREIVHQARLRMIAEAVKLMDIGEKYRNAAADSNWSDEGVALGAVGKDIWRAGREALDIATGLRDRVLPKLEEHAAPPRPPRLNRSEVKTGALK